MMRYLMSISTQPSMLSVLNMFYSSGGNTNLGGRLRPLIVSC